MADVADADLNAIQTAAVTSAERGARGLSIGDRRVDYQDPQKLLQTKRALENENDGGVFTVVFPAKGYYQ